MIYGWYKRWDFNDKSSDGYFNIGTGNYGNLPFTIIFRPEEIPNYQAGDKYRVVISNVSTVDGNLEEITFETTFFNMKD